MYVVQKTWSTSDIADYLCYGFVAKIPSGKTKIMSGSTGIIKAHSGSPFLILTTK